MPFPPNPVYPYAIDSDHTLFLVFNTSETRSSTDNEPWSREVDIDPVDPNADEIWPDNGFANISGELFYYDSVRKNSHGKIYKFLGCARNLGGAKTQFNEAGTWVRGFVVAEHHNQIAQTIINIEQFLLEITEDIDRLVDEPSCQDDVACPEVIFEFNPDPQSSACEGTLASYNLIINGAFNSFSIDFGDGTSTNSSQNGTHVYPPNSKIDPIVTVSNGNCQIVQTSISRTNPDEPKPNVDPPPFTIPTIDFPNIPTISVPSIDFPDTNLTFPPIQLPCINFSPFDGFSIGDINIPSIIVVEPGIPSSIEFSPLSIPSIIIFENIPSFSPIDFGPAPSYSPIDFGPAPSFSPIDFGPAPSFSPIDFGPAPSFSPIDFGPAPSFSPIDFGPAPSFSPIDFGPAPSFSPIDFGPAPSFSPIDFGPAPSFSPIDFGPAPYFAPIDFGPAPYFAPIDFGPAPSFAPIQFGPAPSFAPIGFGPVNIPSVITVVGSIPSIITFDGGLPSNITFDGGLPSNITFDGGLPSNITFDGSLPDTITLDGSIPSTITVDSSIPSSITVDDDIPDTITLDGSIPDTITVTGNIPSSITCDWNGPTSITCDCNVTVTCPSSSLQSNVMAKSSSASEGDYSTFLDDTFSKSFGISSSDIGIPDEIKLIVPAIPNISLIHDLPSVIQVESPDIPSIIHIIGPLVPIPSEIKIVGADAIPNQIQLVSNVPSVILVESERIPSSIKIEAPDNLSILLDTSLMPSSIHVVGMPSTIEVIADIPKTIGLKVEEGEFVPMKFVGGPIPLKLEYATPTGENGEDLPCFALMPCGSK